MSQNSSRSNQSQPQATTQENKVSNSEVTASPESASAPQLALRRVTAPPTRSIKSSDLLALQRTVGNQAVMRLLNAQKKPLAPPIIQRDVMTVDQFVENTPGHRSSLLKEIDEALKVYKKDGQGTEFAATYLNKVLNAIDSWLSSDHENQERIAQVKTLREQVAAEIDTAKENKNNRLETVGVDLGATVSPTKKSKFTDFDGKQYRISGQKPDRLIEEVFRSEENGVVTYYATGQVVDFQSDMPVVVQYAEPRNLGDWYPRVTHLNGMAVKPQEGIESAMTLQQSINTALDEKMNEHGVAVSQDILYTYSAQQANGGVKAFGLDLVNCLKGKVRIDDTVTEEQETIMLDAVRNKHRTTVSAHSRGTIKTDNAVRNAYATLKEEFAAEAIKTDEIKNQAKKQARREAKKFTRQYHIPIDPNTLIGPIERELAGKAGGERAKTEMDQYIQLIYAGNAVQYPSSVLKIEMFVGTYDMVSMGVGSYTNLGAKLSSGNMDTTLHKVSGGHGFVENYSKQVGNSIAQDIANEVQQQEQDDDDTDEE